MERREAARAEALAREHARVAQRNLEIVMENREVLERLPGASLIKLDRAAEEEERPEWQATVITARSSAASCATTS